MAFGIVAASAAHGDVQLPPEPAVSKQFTPGQVWRYKTRANEEASRVVIGKIESAPKVGTIVHVKLVGLRIEDPINPDDLSSEIYHVPISESALAASVTGLSDEKYDLDGFSDGYNLWLSTYKDSGGGALTHDLSEVVFEGGVFTLSLSEVADAMEHVVKQGGVKVTRPSKSGGQP